MDRSKMMQIRNETRLVSMSKRGNRLFRIGVAPFEQAISHGPNNCSRIKIEPRRFSGNSLYKLGRSAAAKGFFGCHNGPTLDYYYFSLKMVCNEDVTILGYYSSGLEGAGLLDTAVQMVSHADFDLPMGGFDIIADEIEFKRVGYSEADFITEIQRLINYMFSYMLENSYFDICS